MSAIQTQPVKLLRPFCRWCNVVATEQGVVISRYNKTKALSWPEIAEPPQLERRFPWYTFTIKKAQASFRFAASATEFINQLHQFWALHYAPQLKLQVAQIEARLKRHYLCDTELAQVQQQATKLLKPWRYWQVSTLADPTLHAALNTLREICQWQNDDIVAFREAFEAFYLNQYETFFNQLYKQPLTRTQRLACIRSAKHQLLLAAAGSGKTSVMVARCAYLIEHGLAVPQDILLLAYGNDAAKEMQARLATQPQTQGVKVYTFHALGLHILQQVEGTKTQLSPLATEPQALKAFVQQTLLKLLADPRYQGVFQQFIARQSAALGVSTNNVAELPNLTDWQTWLGSSAGKKVCQYLETLLSAYKEYSATEKVGDLQIKHRADLDCFLPLFAEYQLALQTQQCIDYQDMIARSTLYVNSGRYIPPWQHILVDEFQDISRSRATLLKALLAKQHDSRLFAVGDDWQAIYGFSGADIRLTTEFAAHFSPAAQMELDKTFRFHQGLVDISNQFVRQNPSQCQKALTAFDSERREAVVTLSHDEAEGADKVAIAQVLAELAEHNRQGCSVVILARFNKDLPEQALRQHWQRQFPHLALRYMTVHAAKGQESDFAIINNVSSGRFGFPAEQPTAPLLAALLPPTEPFPHAQERRLFYVALTRAKQKVFVLYPHSRPSEFITELH
ncbi:UvrD-helicase domain-containing protein [Pseudoalteromonas fenneropenaei]|uniref:DNA 3'-5' helicase n=1 Tax=Pseudoalteromonas fenneropenaei TaxID=1737459 RepID=A0ABV7CI35_9GAMM